MLILQGVPPLGGVKQGWDVKNKTFTSFDDLENGDSYCMSKVAVVD